MTSLGAVGTLDKWSKIGHVGRRNDALAPAPSLVDVRRGEEHLLRGHVNPPKVRSGVDQSADPVVSNDPLAVEDS